MFLQFILITMTCPFQLTSQDKTAQVIERALQKHNLENASVQDFALIQILAQDKGEHRASNVKDNCCSYLKGPYISKLILLLCF